MAASMGVLFLVAQGCAASRPPEADLPTGSGPYAARLEITAGAGSRRMAFEAGCAVDPALGGRIEVRDPMGGTRLLLLISRERGVWIDPGRNLEAEWVEALPEFPWSPGDLWLMLTRQGPEGAGCSRNAEGLTCRWESDLGNLRARLEPGDGPLKRSAVRGPGRARLEIEFLGVRAAEVSPASFAPPPGNRRTARLEDLLAGLAP